MIDHLFAPDPLIRPRRFLGSTAIFVSVVVAATGCSVLTSRTEPTPKPVPPVVWTNGEPSGELESTEYVQLLREALPALAAANNQSNFTLPEAYEVIATDPLSRHYGAALDRAKGGFSPLTYPGPQPFTPTKVEEAYKTDDGPVIEVTGCEIFDWASVEGTAPSKPFKVTGKVYQFTEVEGAVKLSAEKGYPDLDCDGVEIKIGVFDPTPEPSSITDVEQIIGPVHPGNRASSAP